MMFLMIFLFWSSTVSAQEAWETLEVPLVYGAPDIGWGRINYRFQQPYDPDKPVLMIVEDALTQFLGGQDFARDAMGQFNVLLIRGRYSQSNFGANLWDGGEELDWAMAYKVFNSSQQVKDLEAIRKVVLNNRPISLLGESSGAAMAQHYVSRYPDKVKKVLLIDPMLLDLQQAMGIMVNNILPDGSKSFEDVFWECYQKRKPFSNEDAINEASNNIALQVRVFEHLYTFLDTEAKLPSPLIWLGEKGASLVKFYQKSTFSVEGIHYDHLRDFKGKALVLSGQKDKLVDHRVDQVLTSYYGDGSFFLFNDGHRLPAFQSSKYYDDLLVGLLGEDIKKKQVIYKKLWDEAWLYPIGNRREF